MPPVPVVPVRPPEAAVIPPDPPFAGPWDPQPARKTSAATPTVKDAQGARMTGHSNHARAGAASR